MTTNLSRNTPPRTQLFPIGGAGLLGIGTSPGPGSIICSRLSVVTRGLLHFVVLLFNCRSPLHTSVVVQSDPSFAACDISSISSKPGGNVPPPVGDRNGGS